MRLSHQSIVAKVVEELEQRILSGALQPGERITEESLSKQWEVSRSSLREAFRILESQGFVDHTPRRGIKVAVITPRKVREVYQVGAALEGLTVQLAVEKNDPKVIERLQKLQKRMQAKVSEGDIKEYQKLNQQFHEILIKASDNEFIIKTLTPINKLAKRLRAEVFVSPQGVEKSLLNHAVIISAFKNGNSKEAGETRAHTVLEFGKMLESLLDEKIKMEQ